MDEQITVPKVGNGSRPPLDGSPQTEWPDNTGPYRAKTDVAGYGTINADQNATEFVIKIIDVPSEGETV